MNNALRYLMLPVVSLFLLMPFMPQASAEDPQTPVAVSAPILAQEDDAVATDSAVDQEEGSDYALPYPGILLDHPLYFLKDIRDRIMAILIADPIKKAEFGLLKADKFHAMAQQLRDRDSWDLALTALERSAEETRNAANMLNARHDEGAPIPPEILGRFNASLRMRIADAGLMEKAVGAENAVRAQAVLQSLGQSADTLKNIR